MFNVKLYENLNTLNSAYNKVAFNEKLAIMKENLHTKYTPFTYNDVALNEKVPLMKQNLCIFFFIIGRVECTDNAKIVDHSVQQSESSNIDLKISVHMIITISII